MKKTKETKFFGGKKLTKNNLGFYIALAVCIVTVAAAAWTTYGSIIQSQSDVLEETDNSEIQTAEDVSGESYEKSVSESDNSLNSYDKSSDEKNNYIIENSIEEKQSEEENSDMTYYPVENKSTIKVFSVSNPVFSKTTSDWRTHSGVDFPAEKGTAVRSIFKGVVKSVYKDAMYGNVIEIERDGFCAKYCGLSDNPIVKEGDNVEAGSTIGYVGIIPCEILDGEHIHLETSVNGVAIDPMSILERHHK